MATVVSAAVIFSFDRPREERSVPLTTGWKRQDQHTHQHGTAASQPRADGALVADPGSNCSSTSHQVRGLGLHLRTERKEMPEPQPSLSTQEKGSQSLCPTQLMLPAPVRHGRLQLCLLPVSSPKIHLLPLSVGPHSPGGHGQVSGLPNPITQAQAEPNPTVYNRQQGTQLFHEAPANPKATLHKRTW